MSDVFHERREFFKGMAFGAAAASLGCALTAVSLESQALPVTLSVILASIASPAWFGIGTAMSLANLGGKATPAHVRQALSVAMLVVLPIMLVAFSMLLYYAHPLAMMGFVLASAGGGAFAIWMNPDPAPKPEPIPDKLETAYRKEK